MKRGDLYRAYKTSKYDPKRYRVFAVVSRQVCIDSKFSTVICAPVYSVYDGLSTQVQLGIDDGLKGACSIHCDELVSIPKAVLTNYVSTLSQDKAKELNRALSLALEIETS